MKIIKYTITISILFTTILTPYRHKFYAIAATREYNYNNFSYTHATNKIIDNTAVILSGSQNKKITIGNESIADSNKSSSITNDKLQLHHIFFKAMRTSFPAIPYVCIQNVCIQIPKSHHTQE